MEKFDIKGLYDEWFLDYASYVILERAIPNIDDGLKPVQRRILHSMSIIDDGRFNKVANIIGHTMQYHPHGDAAIGDAIVKIGQKQFLIETQGNWGNINTGDKAAAPRYIEAKLSDFAKDILFNKEITNWKDSYDGRNNEPIQLPSKFPLILLQGAEGIAVGLSTKILPHNFKEITKALIASINGKNIKILPDFITGGIADFSKYNGGFKGSKVKIRAEIDIDEDKNLIIRSVPYNVTTQSLIESIVKANDSGKIKIRKIEDNTAEKVEIKIILTKGVSPHVTMDALFAFTSCEVTISPNCCLIVNNKPTFLKVEEIIKWYSDQTKEIFSKELNLELEKLNKKWHFLSLKKLFIENKVYQKIEDCSTWDEIINTIMKAMMLLAGKIKKSLTKEDIIQLTEIKIKTISKFDMEKIADEIHRIEENILEVENNIKHIDQYTIRYYEMLLDKYGELHKRRTVVSSLDSIEVKQVAVSNKKLLVDKKEGFIGTKITSGEYLSPCSDIDDIIIFRKN
ncbi:MAG: DNA topoisomerase IV, partial [bacterium TMED198]